MGRAGTGSTCPGGGGPADSELKGREELLALISRTGGGRRSSAGRLPLRVGGGICGSFKPVSSMMMRRQWERPDLLEEEAEAPS